MRWRPYKRPEIGTEKLVERFLFLPVKLHRPDYKGYEWRWLERAWLYKRFYRVFPAGKRRFSYRWRWDRWGE